MPSILSSCGEKLIESTFSLGMNKVALFFQLFLFCSFVILFLSLFYDAFFLLYDAFFFIIRCLLFIMRCLPFIFFMCKCFQFFLQELTHLVLIIFIIWVRFTVFNRVPAEVVVFLVAFFVAAFFPSLLLRYWTFYLVFTLLFTSFNVMNLLLMPLHLEKKDYLQNYLLYLLEYHCHQFPVVLLLHYGAILPLHQYR